MTNEDREQLKESLRWMGADVSEDGNDVVMIAEAIVEDEIVKFPGRGSTHIRELGYIPIETGTVEGGRNVITCSPMKVNPDGFVRKLNEDLNLLVSKCGETIIVITGKIGITVATGKVRFGDPKRCVDPEGYGYKITK